MDLRIAAVGSNQIIAEEVLKATQLIVGENISVRVYLTSEVADDSIAELFVCAITQLAALRKAVPAEKIVVLDLAPTSQFYVQVARIPAGENVYVFNPHAAYIKILAESCNKLGINEVTFVPIAYGEMPEEEVFEKLRNAKYIIGVGKTMGEAVLLSEKYRFHLRKDVTIIGTTRVASVESACVLIQWVATYFHRTISTRVAVITSKLNNTVEDSGVYDYAQNFTSVADEMGKLVDESEHSASVIRNAVLKSFANQISPDIIMTDSRGTDGGQREKGSKVCPSVHIGKTLEDISGLSSALVKLTQKIGR